MIKQKIMKTVYRFLLVALLAMAATSCLYEDKGNYDYHAINDITIGGIASGQEYPVVSFVDTLRIKPQITCAQSTDESTLEYQWSVLITEGEQYERVIGKEKNLEWPADLKAGKYTGLFKVYDKISGLSWIQSFKIVATTVPKGIWFYAGRKIAPGWTLFIRSIKTVNWWEEIFLTEAVWWVNRSDSIIPVGCGAPLSYIPLKAPGL